MALSYQEIYNAIIYQLGALNGFCKLYNTKIHHVKPHGALTIWGLLIVQLLKL